jgi:hypothetical protein
MAAKRLSRKPNQTDKNVIKDSTGKNVLIKNNYLHHWDSMVRGLRNDFSVIHH